MTLLLLLLLLLSLTMSFQGLIHLSLLDDVDITSDDDSRYHDDHGELPS